MCKGMRVPKCVSDISTTFAAFVYLCRRLQTSGDKQSTKTAATTALVQILLLRQTKCHQKAALNRANSQMLAR